MDLIDLKKAILSKSIDKVNFIFVYKDIPLVSYQYLDSIANLKGMDKVYVDNLNDISSSNIMFSSNDNNLYIYITDILDKQFKIDNNIIIVCKKVSDNILNEIDQDRIIEFPKLEKWQVLEYINSSCKGLNKDDSEALYDICNGDVFRIDNELGKIKPFNDHLQQAILHELIESNNFKDLDNITGYQIANALMKRDRNSIVNLISHELDIEPMELIGILKNNLYNVIRIQMDPKATANSLGMNYKQFMAIKYNCNKYSNNELIKLYDFMTGIDYRLKSGKLEIDNNVFNNYILSQFLAI